jgi:hypothetical protein
MVVFGFERNAAMKLLAVLAACLLIAPFSLADSPAPAPANDDIPALIKRLGDSHFKIRDEASEKLRHLGKQALPALSNAQKSDDPEVRQRAQVISQQIDEDLHPKAKADLNGPQGVFGRGPGQGGLALGGGNGQMQIHIKSAVMNGNGRSVSISKTNNGTVKETTVKEDGKTTKIHEDADGIAVTITQMKDGKEVSETTKARDKETLKKENPKVFEVYEKLAKDDVTIEMPGRIRIQGRMGNGNGPAELEKLLEEARRRNEAELANMRKEMEERLAELRKREVQKPEVDEEKK